MPTGQPSGSPTAMGSQAEGLSIDVTAASQRSGQEAAFDGGVSGGLCPPQAPRSWGQDAAAAESGNESSETIQRRTAADAAAVLHSWAEADGEAAATGEPFLFCLIIQY